MPLESDDSVEWILRSTKNPDLAALKLKVIPVTISYDRIFDSSLLIQEFISGKKSDMNLAQLLTQIYKMPSGKLGKIFVKYQEPIDINEYMNENSKLRFDEQAFKLTKLLYSRHEKEMAVSQNSMVSASMLFHPKPELSLKKLSLQCNDLYK
jgi:glycerol-3-phosphate O-acyltransferase